MENRRPRCVYIISCLIFAVCLISFTDGDDHTEDYLGDYFGVGDITTIADDNSSTAIATEFTKDPTISTASFTDQMSPKNEQTDDKSPTQKSTSSNNSIIIQMSAKNGTSEEDEDDDDDDDDDYDEDLLQDPTRSIDVTVPMQPKNGPIGGNDDKGSKIDYGEWGQDNNHEQFYGEFADISTTNEVSTETEFDKIPSFDMYEHKDNVHKKFHVGDPFDSPTTRISDGVTKKTMPLSQSEKTEKSSTTVLILAGLIAVIISAGLSICISYCVASTIVKKKGYNKSDKMTESQGEVPLDQIVCTSVQSTEESSKLCNEEGVSVEVNQHENEQEASKDEGFVVVADNQTNETKVTNEQDNEVAESVTGDKDDNEASEAAIKLFVEQCMSGETVNNANVQAATGSVLTDPQPTEKASVDATGSIPSVDATNINAAPIDQSIDMPSLNTTAMDPPQT